MEPWFVKDTHLVQRLDEEDFSRFHQICPHRSYGRGEAVYRAGDEASAFHIVLEGQVKLVGLTADGKERIVAICGPQDFFGNAFLLRENQHRFDAVALTKLTTCPVNHEQFRQLMAEVPNFVFVFTQIIATHLLYCRELHVHAYNPVKSRVMRMLIEQAQRFGKPLEGGWYELQTELTHEEIASLISATRVSVSTSMAQLRMRGLIEGTRGVYRLNLPALKSLLEAL